MATANMGPASSGKRSLDAEINLVPFIDLLSMCICFLLITAVWIQIAVVQVKQGKGTEVDPTTAAFDINVRFSTANKIEAEISKNGRVAKRVQFAGASTAEALTKMDSELDGWVRGVVGKSLLPTDSLSKVVGSAMVSPKRGINYGELVLAMDSLRRHQIVNIGVMPTEAK